MIKSVRFLLLLIAFVSMQIVAWGAATGKTGSSAGHSRPHQLAV